MSIKFIDIVYLSLIYFCIYTISFLLVLIIVFSLLFTSFLSVWPLALVVDAVVYDKFYLF